MAKDPAILFYTSDFLTGVMFMNDAQIGKYIKLLCLQHQTGRLTEEDMMNICNTYDKKVFDKFTKDENGLYYNERMEEEKLKRQNYSLSRANNRKSVKKQDNQTDMLNISKSYVKHMENENEDENINKDINIDKDKKNNFDDADFWEFYNSFNSKSDINKTINEWKHKISAMERTLIKKHLPLYHIGVTEEKYRGTFLGYLEKRKWLLETPNKKMYILNNGTEYEVSKDFTVFADYQTVTLNEEQRKLCYYK